MSSAANFPIPASSPTLGGEPPGDLLPLISAAARRQIWEREDPFFEVELWDHPPHFQPRSMPHRTMRDDGTLTWQTQPEFDPEGSATWKQVVRRPNIARVIAVVDGLKHLTATQITCFGGWAPGNATRYLAPPWKTGLVERGKFQPAVPIPGRKPWLYALHHGEPLHRWVKTLNEADRAAIFGADRAPHASGSPLVARHDVITAEIVLRLCEIQPNWVAVTPEPDATPQRLLVSTHERIPRFNADAVLHRHDGLRVALEVTCSRNLPHIRSKLRRWAQLFTTITPAQAGLVVVFVNAHPDLEQHGSLAATIRRIYVEETSPGTLRSPAGTLVSDEQCRDARVGIQLASWLDWFPRPRRLSVGAAHGVAYGTPDGHRWLVSHLAEPAAWPYTPPDGHSPTPPTTDRGGWAGQPTWVGHLALNTPPQATVDALSG